MNMGRMGRKTPLLFSFRRGAAKKCSWLKVGAWSQMLKSLDYWAVNFELAYVFPREPAVDSVDSGFGCLPPAQFRQVSEGFHAIQGWVLGV